MNGGFRRNRRGQAMVELALVLPILLLLVMGVIDLGRVYNGYMAVTSAAREGARRAALGGSDTAVTATAVAAAVPLPTTALTVEVTPASRYPGTNATVKVIYQCPVLTPLMQAILGNTFTVSGQAVMKIE